jgi:hypothetical protein
MKRPHTNVYWIALAAAVGLAIGSIGPWVSYFDVTDSGLDKDGVLTLPAALGAIAGLIHHDRQGTRGGLIAALVLGGLAALITVIDYFDVQGDETADLLGASVEWGLYLAVFSAIVLFVASLMLFLRHRQEAGAAPPAAGA